MKAWSARRTAVTAVTVLVLAAVGGCLALLGERPERIEPARVPGVWTGSDGGRVELRADGRFEMSGIPRSALVLAFVDPPPGDGGLSGSGTWEFGEEDDGDKVESVQLYVDAGGSFSGGGDTEELRVARSGEKPVLYFSTDSDKWYGYELRRTG